MPLVAQGENVAHIQPEPLGIGCGRITIEIVPILPFIQIDVTISTSDDAQARVDRSLRIGTRNGLQGSQDILLIAQDVEFRVPDPPC